MNRINEFHLEPGPYRDPAEKIIVVTDVINKLQHIADATIETLSDPYVITRPLSEKIEQHDRLAIPLSVFKSKYKKI